MLEFALIYAWLDLSIDPLFTALIFLSYFILTMAAIVFLIKSIFRRQLVNFLHFASISLVVFSTMLISAYILSEMRQSSITKADTLIDQLESYKKRNGNYPSEISQKYGFSSKSGVTRMGLFIEHEYNYRVNDAGYTLSFSEPAFMVTSYDSNTKEWAKRD